MGAVVLQEAKRGTRRKLNMAVENGGPEQLRSKDPAKLQ